MRKGLLTMAAAALLALPAGTQAQMEDVEIKATKLADGVHMLTGKGGNIGVLTGPDGTFALASVAGGQVLVEVEREGYAAYQELVWIMAGRPNQRDRLTFTLQPAASMTVAFTAAASARPSAKASRRLRPGSRTKRLSVSP